MKSFIYFVFISFFTGCFIIKPSNSLEEKVHYNNLIKLENKLVKPDLTVDSIIARQLYENALIFIESFPKSRKKENVLVFASKSSDALDRNKENLILIDKLLTNFPNSQNAPNYLYNKGKIFEEKINDLEKAKIIYQELIDKYPKSELAYSLKDYLIFLNLSKENQLEYLNQ